MLVQIVVVGIAVGIPIAIIALALWFHWLAGIVVLAAIAAFIIWEHVTGKKYAKMMADKTYALQFVHIEEDGTARELSADEVDYLNTEFEGADGARPYIKSRYKQLTPDNKIWGYLERRKLPRGMQVKKV